MFLTQKTISGRGALFRSLEHRVYVYIPNFHFKLILEQKNFLVVFKFGKVEIHEVSRYTLYIKASHRRDTIMSV